MRKFKFHHKLLSFVFTLSVADGIKSNLEKLPPKSDKFLIPPDLQSETNVTTPTHFDGSTKRSKSGNYGVFPQSYSKTGGQGCKFFKGKIQCRNRRDSEVGGYSDGGDKTQGGNIGFDTFGGSDGYGVQPQKASTFKYQIYPAMMESGSGWGMPQVMSGGWGQEEDEIGGDVDLKKYIGVLGLLGLKGLKGLKGVGLLKGLKGILALPLLPFLPILLPILLLGLLAVNLLPLLLLLFLPVLVITGGRQSRSAVGLFPESPELLKMVLNSDQCVERISCELAVLGRPFIASSFTEKVMKVIQKDNDYRGKIFAGIKQSKKLDAFEQPCSKFECNFPALKLPLNGRNQTSSNK